MLYSLVPFFVLFPNIAEVDLLQFKFLDLLYDLWVSASQEKDLRKAFKPPTCSIRMSSIDGGGSRGMIPLENIVRIQNVLGPNLNKKTVFSEPKRRRKVKPRLTVLVDTDSEGIEEDHTAPNLEDDDSTASSIANAYEGEDETEISSIRTNSIDSVHQRHWFMLLDRTNSGFQKVGGTWSPAAQNSGFDPFFTRGANIERTVVTGHTSAKVMADEGVEGFVGRKIRYPRFLDGKTN
jgi:hypothetical protein